MNKEREGQHSVKLYFQDYVKWFPERWEWDIADEESRKLYMEFRARRCTMSEDHDKVPYFDSIEKDANQFDMREVEFTDIFGIRWKGKKGVHRYAGDADYAVHMYYWDPEEEDDEMSPCVSDEVTADKIPEGYAEIYHNGVKEFIDAEDIVDFEYRYIVENHLFKDSYVVISYGDPIPPRGVWDTDKSDEDYDAFYDRELAFRRALLYPPEGHIMAVLFYGKDEKTASDVCNSVTKTIVDKNKDFFDNNMLMMNGPAQASISKQSDFYRFLVYFKSLDYECLTAVCGTLDALSDEIREKKVNFQTDFDPMSSY